MLLEQACAGEQRREIERLMAAKDARDINFVEQVIEQFCATDTCDIE